ncbi:MAG: 50S ribosomal protein L10 [Spirochaetales bacterium]|nr:50S ribosomal protein L10 [Spirochaetales bacterium]
MAKYETKLQDGKLNAVKALVDEFKDVKDFIFTDYRGLTVEQITDLRNKLRDNKAVYKVVKNRFAKIALKQLDKPEVQECLVGPTAVALPMGESGPVAKILIEFAKNAPLEIKGGILDGNLFTTEQVVAFSKLPGRLELISQLMSTMKAPVQNVVYLLNAVPTKLVRTLQAVADSKK